MVKCGKAEWVWIILQCTIPYNSLLLLLAVSHIPQRLFYPYLNIWDPRVFPLGLTFFFFLSSFFCLFLCSFVCILLSNCRFLKVRGWQRNGRASSRGENHGVKKWKMGSSFKEKKYLRKRAMDDKNAAEIHKTNILTKTFLLLLLSAASSFLRWTKEIGLSSHNIFYFNSPLLRLRWQYTIWSLVFYSRALLLNVTNSACGHEEAFFWHPRS